MYSIAVDDSHCGYYPGHNGHHHLAPQRHSRQWRILAAGGKAVGADGSMWHRDRRWCDVCWGAYLQASRRSRASYDLLSKSERSNEG